MSSILFFIAAIGVISGAVGRGGAAPIRSTRCSRWSRPALARRAVLLLRAEFVAAIQVVIYAGAVMVLYVFVVAYRGRSGRPIGERCAAHGRGRLQLRAVWRDLAGACSSSS